MDFYTRDLQASDIQGVYELYAHPEVAKYQLWDVATYEETEQFINSVLEKEEHWIYNVIINADTDKIIGIVQLIVDNDNKSAEIGFIVHPDFWEQGIASDIATTMVKYGFKVLKLNRIWGSLDARNVAARIVLQNANMKHEAVLREDKAVEDGFRDTLIFAIIKSEY